jgi:streptogramin lyase
MNAQLKYTMAPEGRTRLRHAKPRSDRPAVWRHARLNVHNYLRARSVFGHGGCGLGARVWARLVVVAVALLWFGASAALADPVGQVREFSTGPNTAPQPEYVAPGADGNLWFTEISLELGVASVIGRITPSGQITEFSAGLANTEPMGIAPAPDGNMWFADWYGHAIGRITLSGQVTEYSSGLNAKNDVVGIAPGADGNMWFTDEFGAIGRITPSGQITEYSAGLNPGSEPLAIAPGPDGNLWFADEGATPAIGRITPSGQITEYSAGLNPSGAPSGIAVGPDGNLWFVDNGVTPAIGRITPSGQITEYTNGLNPFPDPGSIAAGPDGNLWFTDKDGAIGRVTPLGQITEYSAGLNPGSQPIGIAPGSDGNMWFTDLDGAIGRIGTGAAPALQTPASVTGAGRPGSPEACQAQWSDWSGYTARAGLYSFDGYAWLRDGNPIPGQTTPTYTPTGADLGHELACRATVTYPLPFQLTATATSPAITIQPAPPPPPPMTPALSALNISPRTFTLKGRRVRGRCEPATRSNRTHRTCTRRVALSIRFTLSASATVSLTIQRALPGREIHGRCQPPTPNNHRHRGCTRLETLPGTSVVTGAAGANAFTFTAATSGHPLSPGSYRLLATPTTDGHSGNQQDTTFQINP